MAGSGRASGAGECSGLRRLENQIAAGGMAAWVGCGGFVVLGVGVCSRVGNGAARNTVRNFKKQTGAPIYVLPTHAQ